MPHQLIDQDLNCNNDTYTIKKQKDAYLLRRITIEKDQLLYAFIGGMWYTTDSFSFQNQISLPYPFSTYYTFKILDKNYENQLYRSLLYVKTPMLILQQKKSCYCILFDPYIHFKKEDIFPFIGLRETDTEFIISLYLFSDYTMKTKKSEWLGKGKKQTIHHHFKEHDSFTCSIKVSSFENWEEAVLHFFQKNNKKNHFIQQSEIIFHNAKKALYRSYDDITGSFLQLPWKTTTGFTFQNSSYSLLSYEAVRMEYFLKWYQKTKDEQFLLWSKKLRNHFVDKNLYIIPKKRGKGIIWYNMTNLTKRGLTGYFYMDCGYAGYPGGQASIAFHILQFLKENTDKELERNLKKSLTYLLSTQNQNGSWPMAIKQEGLIRFRRENMENYISYGGTGESARALFAAYQKFKNTTYKKHAEKALSFLNHPFPICYNGLRDIGIMEPEAFSAVSIIHAFLDGYDVTKKDQYLTQAFTHAQYLITWIYMFDTSNWNMTYNFHPISYSITPRLSPYETVWVISLFNRLAEYRNHDFWTQLAQNCYNSILPWISETGGLSEGVFPHYHDACYPLPMEQTFATVELMNASLHYMTKKKKTTKKYHPEIQKQVELSVENSYVLVQYKNKIICKIDASSCSITEILGKKIGNYGITLSIQGPFSLKNKIKNRIIKQCRGPIGKYILGIKDASYAVTGVRPPKQRKKVIDVIGKHIKNTSIEKRGDNSVTIHCQTAFHSITLFINVFLSKQDVTILIDPIRINVCDHDVFTNSVIFPLTDEPIKKKTNQQMIFEDFSIEGEFKEFVSINDYNGIDQTLQSNWTHGGIFSTELMITIPLEKVKKMFSKP